MIQFGSFENEDFNHINIEETWNDIVADKRMAPKGRGREYRKVSQRGKGKKNEVDKEFVCLGQSPTIGTESAIFMNPTPNVVINNLYMVTPSLSKPLKYNSLLQKLPNKKIPKTTAIRKGIMTTTPESLSTTESVKRRRSTTLSLSEDVDNLDNNSLSDDDAYIPSDHEGDSDSDESDNSLVNEAEVSSDDDLGFLINDNFDLYEGPHLDDYDDEQDNYFAKLYENGEMYPDEEFGKIGLKPWQIFMDKQHLRDVVRDYCIQSGFSIIVASANNLKYNVICRDMNCGWRLHAGRLPDGITLGHQVHSKC